MLWTEAAFSACLTWLLTIIDNAIDGGMDVFAHVCGQKMDTSSIYCDNIQPWQETFQFSSNVTRFLDCYFWKLSQIWTSNFRRVVQQHTDGVVVSITWFLLQIYFSFQQWKKMKILKNWEIYRYEFGVLLFGTQCVYYHKSPNMYLILDISSKCCMC